MDGLSIRTAEMTDIVALRDVYRRSSLSNNGDTASLLANPDALDFKEASVHEHRTRVAIHGERVIGFASIRGVGDIVELEDLFVEPESMRRGIGRALVVDATEVARSLGAKRVEVTANGHALAFYDATGFVVDGVAETQFGPGHRMHLDLPQA